MPIRMRDSRRELKLMKRPLLFACLCMGAGTTYAQYAPPAPPADGVRGYWSTDGGAVLNVHDCGAAVCIRIVTISQRAPGVVDGRNPNPELRTRPVCKIDIGAGFIMKDPNHGNQGKVYDPENGKTYKASMTSDGNTLRLRGYIGIKALGRNEIWKRTSAEYATCEGLTRR